MTAGTPMDARLLCAAHPGAGMQRAPQRDADRPAGGGGSRSSHAAACASGAPPPHRCARPARHRLELTADPTKPTFRGVAEVQSWSVRPRSCGCTAPGSAWRELFTVGGEQVVAEVVAGGVDFLGLRPRARCQWARWP